MNTDNLSKFVGERRRIRGLVGCGSGVRRCRMRIDYAAYNIREREREYGAKGIRMNFDFAICIHVDILLILFLRCI